MKANHVENRLKCIKLNNGFKLDDTALQNYQSRKCRMNHLDKPLKTQQNSSTSRSDVLWWACVGGAG